MDKTEAKPRIRFKGFSDAWEQRKLGDVANRFDNLRVPVAANERTSGTTPYYGANGIQDYVDGFTHDGEFILVAEDGANDLKNYPVQYVCGKIWVNNHAHVLQAKSESADNRFLKYNISHTNIEPFLVGGGRAKLNSEVMMNIEITSSKLPEQQKIGAFFSNLDNLITLHQRKLDKINNLKKAMLEKLFPKNGSDAPEIRFKGFSDAWAQNKVKNLCSIGTGKSNTQDKIASGKYPFYVRSPIIEKSNKYIFDEEAVITVGDGVGTGKVYHYIKGRYDLHQRCYRMTDFSGIVGKYFFYYFSEHFYNRVMMMTAKTSVDSVRLEMIADMEIQMPNDLTEQNKIATFFDTLDNLITLYQHKLEKLKNIKKACLEKMFI